MKHSSMLLNEIVACDTANRKAPIFDSAVS